MRQTLNSFLEDFTKRGNQTVFTHRPEWRTLRWSGRRIAETAYQFARELEARRIEKGDRVVFCARNSPEWVAAFFGCLLRGVIVVPLDLQSAKDFIRRVQQQTSPKLFLYTKDAVAQVDANLAALDLEELPQQIARQAKSPYAGEPINEDDLVEIIYTSGTTAEPKGVCLTHKNLLANLNPLESGMQKYLKWEWLVHPLRFLNLLPLSHVFGQFMGLFVPQLLTGEVCFQDSLSPAEIINTIKRERVSVVVTTPRLLDSLRRKITGDYQSGGKAERFQELFERLKDKHFLWRWWAFRDLHRRFGWKFWAFVSGGATLDEETEEFWHRLGYLTVQGYGMTETASLVSFNNPFEATRGSLGKTFASQEIKLDESGEILVRGGNVSAGYWNQGAPSGGNSEGWLATGDLGEMDAEGKLYFKGRKKDTIVTSAGLKIYPEDLEAELNHQPGVRDSVVLGVAGAKGPEPLAVLLLSDEAANPQTIIQGANEKLSDYQRIRRYLVWTEADFPRTRTTRKVKKREIAEAIQSRVTGIDSGQQEIINRSRGNALRETLARVSGEDPLSLTSAANLTTDLKLDSLGRVELLSALEDEYQVELDEATFTAATTVGDIEHMVREGKPAHVRPYPYAEWRYGALAKAIRTALFYLLILPATRLLAWSKVRGREHLKHLPGPVFFVSNHIASIDVALILAALPGRFQRKLATAMLGEQLRDWRYPPPGTIGLKRWLGRVEYVLVVGLFNVFPLPQESGFRRSFAFAGNAIDRGYSLLVFPEGLRTPDGRLHRFMNGTGLLIAGLDVAVVPIKIEGLYELKQQRRKFARPGKITVTFGEAVRYGNNEDAALITKDLERRVSNL
jgi:long-chain acyl-CoA synthetase